MEDQLPYFSESNPGLTRYQAHKKYVGALQARGVNVDRLLGERKIVMGSAGLIRNLIIQGRVTEVKREVKTEKGTESCDFLYRNYSGGKRQRDVSQLPVGVPALA